MTTTRGLSNVADFPISFGLPHRFNAGVSKRRWLSSRRWNHSEPKLSAELWQQCQLRLPCSGEPSQSRTNYLQYVQHRIMLRLSLYLRWTGYHVASNCEVSTGCRGVEGWYCLVRCKKSFFKVWRKQGISWFCYNFSKKSVGYCFLLTSKNRMWNNSLFCFYPVEPFTSFCISDWAAIKMGLPTSPLVNTSLWFSQLMVV